MPAVHLAQLNLFVEDFPVMLAFYRDQLGCQVIDITPGPPAVPLVNWVSFVAGNMILELFDASAYGRDVAQFGASGQGAIELCFIVDDVDSEREKLAQAGIACDPVVEEGWGRFAYFRDPEGTRLQIYQVPGGE
jgi:catechol 2,3-dioxygenase-like lactoylglutathione lyase family enzyme